MIYILFFLIVLIIVIFIISAVIFQLALNRDTDKSAILEKDINKMRNKSEIDNDIINWFNDNKKEVEIKSIDNLLLKGYTVYNGKNTKKWVIFVHGYSVDHTSMIGKAKKIADIGYNVLLVDLRSHGKSEGKYITMGIKECNDIKLWIDYLIKREDAKEIGLFGISMGAATVMMTLGLILPKEVKFCIEDCGYSSVFKVLKYQINKGFHLPTFPFLYVANLYAKIFAKFSLNVYSPLIAVSKTNVPLLMIHGDKDTFVPYKMLDEIYNACNSKKEKLIVKGANHAEAEVIDYNKYWEIIYNFIKEIK